MLQTSCKRKRKKEHVFGHHDKKFFLFLFFVGQHQDKKVDQKRACCPKDEVDNHPQQNIIKQKVKKKSSWNYQKKGEKKTFCLFGHMMNIAMKVNP